MIKTLKGILVCSGCILLSATGCLRTPELEYVANKEGQSTLISDNISTVNGSSIVEQIMAPAHAEGVCEKVNEYTSIEINADVIIPKGNAVPIYSVTPIKMTENTIEDYISVLYDTEEIYNRDFNRYMNLSEEEIYQMIEYYTRTLDTAVISDVPEPIFDNNGDIIEMSEGLKEEFENYLEALKMELLELEDGPDYGDPIYYEFESQTKTFTSWNDADVRMDYLYEIAAYTGKQNNGKEYDLTFIRDGINTEFRFVRQTGTELKFGHMENGISYISCYRGGRSTNQNVCSYSIPEAVEMCSNFLMMLDIEHMDVVRIEELDFYDGDIYLGTEGYVLYFYWSDGEIQDTFTSDNPYSVINVQGSYPLLATQVHTNFNNEDENALTRFPTMAAFSVTNSGIDTVWIQNPLKIQGQMAENVKLLTFDQVLQLGIAKLETLHGDAGRPDRHGSVNIEIGIIELNYARMQALDSIESYTMVPVWDFKDKESGEIMLTLNAIDASIFDREQGY